jgi:AAA15 family ATPase/GTPase
MKKIDYVNVTNFQIWKDVTLELEDFNVIKGSSNSGKSSLVRAINMVLNNDCSNTMNFYHYLNFLLLH